MSQKSKVDPYVRSQIIKALTPTDEQKALVIAGRQSLPTLSNSYLQEQVFFRAWSLRSIQEATQKLVAEGDLVLQGRGIFSLSHATAGTATATAASIG
jgi:hypothetical protein